MPIDGRVSLDDLGLVVGGRMATDHTVMSTSEAEQIVADVWGVTVSARRLPTEKDDTFWLTPHRGDALVIKLSNQNEIAAEIDFEVSLTRHVASVGTVPVPRYLPSTGGDVIVDVVDRAGQHRRARLMTAMSGTPLDSTNSSATERERIGEMLASLRCATASFIHPADRRLYPWDVKNLPALRPLLAIATDYDRRSLLESAFARFTDVAATPLAALRTQVLHNDFSKSNLIVDHDAPGFVTGVIDFGDSVHTAIAVDVATALLNQLPRDLAERPRDDAFAEGRDVLRGYLRRTELTDDELAVLPHLVMGRVVVRALVTLYRASVMTGDTSYTTRNTEQGWAQLRWFLERHADDLSSGFVSRFSRRKD